MLGDVVALNELSLWFLTVKGTLVNINRQRESKATPPLFSSCLLDYERGLHAEKERINTMKMGMKYKIKE